MNRRGFLRALVAAPIAAAVAPLPMARPAFATGGYPKPKRYLVGERGPELVNLPNSVKTIAIKIDQSGEKLGFVVDEMPASPVYWTQGKRALIPVRIGDDGTFIL